MWTLMSDHLLCIFLVLEKNGSMMGGYISYLYTSRKHMTQSGKVCTGKYSTCMSHFLLRMVSSKKMFATIVIHFALEYIRKVKENQQGLEFIVTCSFWSMLLMFIY
jgi:hypothetical protein